MSLCGSSYRPGSADAGRLKPFRDSHGLAFARNHGCAFDSSFLQFLMGRVASSIEDDEYDIRRVANAISKGSWYFPSLKLGQVGNGIRRLRVAPRRFNPNPEAWLPILETERVGHRYKAMYSNTARAHELDTVRDWVVIFHDVPESADSGPSSRRGSASCAARELSAGWNASALNITRSIRFMLSACSIQTPSMALMRRLRTAATSSA
jgi:hypothetical protein